MPEEKYKVSRSSPYTILSRLIYPGQDSPLSQLQVTFAALQAGNQEVFNPTKLVESLQLRTSEQQDAQEYD
jgi:ubiquitin carboxyl-terminal hydrolase 48